MQCRSLWNLLLAVAGVAFLAIAAIAQDKPANPADVDLAQQVGTAIVPTNVTLTVDQIPVFDVLAEIEKQTGNHIVDRRQQASNDEHTQRQKVSIAFRDEPFWSAIDQVLDQWRMGVYNYGGSDALAIVEREPGERPRRQGPFTADRFACRFWK